MKILTPCSNEKNLLSILDTGFFCPYAHFHLVVLQVYGYLNCTHAILIWVTILSRYIWKSYALYHAALIPSCKNIHFIRYFTDKLRGREKEKGIKTKMRVKLAAKLLIIAWTLMKKQEFFDPDYLNIG